MAIPEEQPPEPADEREPLLEDIEDAAQELNETWASTATVKKVRKLEEQKTADTKAERAIAEAARDAAKIDTQVYLAQRAEMADFDTRKAQALREISALDRRKEIADRATAASESKWGTHAYIKSVIIAMMKEFNSVNGWPLLNAEQRTSISRIIELGGQFHL